MEDSKAFESPKDVADYLIDLGYKIRTSTVYKHCKEGRLRRQDDGSVLMSDVRAYSMGLQLVSDKQELEAAAIVSAREEVWRILRAGAVIVQALDELLDRRKKAAQQAAPCADRAAGPEPEALPRDPARHPA